MKRCYKCKKYLKNKTNVFVTFDNEKNYYLCDECKDKFIELFLKQYAKATEDILNEQGKRIF